MQFCDENHLSHWTHNWKPYETLPECRRINSLKSVQLGKYARLVFEWANRATYVAEEINLVKFKIRKVFSSARVYGGKFSSLRML